MRIRAIAFRTDPDPSWLNQPGVFHFVRRARAVSDDDLQRFAVGVTLHGEEFVRFITPKTPVDGQSWTNGLDGVRSLAESILLFDSIEDARNASYRWNWQSATIYKLVEDIEREIVFLEPDLISSN